MKIILTIGHQDILLPDESGIQQILKLLGKGTPVHDRNTSTDPKSPAIPSTPAPAGSARPFGWEVDVQFHPGSGKPKKTFHWRGCSMKMARLKGLLKPNASIIAAIRPVTEEEWMRVYGVGKM